MARSITRCSSGTVEEMLSELPSSEGAWQSRVLSNSGTHSDLATRHRKNQLSDFIPGVYCTSQTANIISKKDNKWQEE